MSSKFHLERLTNTCDDVISIKSVNFSKSFCSTTSFWVWRKNLFHIIESIVKYGNVSECRQNISARKIHGADLRVDTNQHGA